MAARGDVALARFPFTDRTGGTIRPVLVLARIPGPHPDYLVMFVSSQLRHAAPGDLVLRPDHPAFGRSGLKVASLFRVGKVATLSAGLLIGTLGQLDDELFNPLVEHLVRLLRRG